jgi:hypothetical protein
LQNPLTYPASLGNNWMLLGGESISNISYMPTFSSPSRCFVFTPSSMNAAHTAVLKYLSGLGHVAKARVGCLLYPSNPKAMSGEILDAPKVAISIVEGMQRQQNQGLGVSKF